MPRKVQMRSMKKRKISKKSNLKKRGGSYKKRKTMKKKRRKNIKKKTMKGGLNIFHSTEWNIEKKLQTITNELSFYDQKLNKLDDKKLHKLRDQLNAVKVMIKERKLGDIIIKSHRKRIKARFFTEDDAETYNERLQIASDLFDELHNKYLSHEAAPGSEQEEEINPSLQPVLDLEGLKETEIQALKGLEFIDLKPYLGQGFKPEIKVLEKTIKLNGEHLFKDGVKKGSLIVNPDIKNDITGSVYDPDSLAEKLSKFAQYILKYHKEIISQSKRWRSVMSSGEGVEATLELYKKKPIQKWDNKDVLTWANTAYKTIIDHEPSYFNENHKDLIRKSKLTGYDLLEQYYLSKKTQSEGEGEYVEVLPDNFFEGPVMDKLTQIEGSNQKLIKEIIYAINISLVHEGDILNIDKQTLNKFKLNHNILSELQYKLISDLFIENNNELDVNVTDITKRVGNSNYEEEEKKKKIDNLIALGLHILSKY